VFALVIVVTVLIILFVAMSPSNSDNVSPALDVIAASNPTLPPAKTETELPPSKPTLPPAKTETETELPPSKPTLPPAKTKAELPPAKTEHCRSALQMADGRWVDKGPVNDESGAPLAKRQDDPLHVEKTLGYRCPSEVSQKEESWFCSRKAEPETSRVLKAMRYRWSPRSCEMMHFDAEAMLQALKSRAMYFVGDSLSDQHFMSLECQLGHAQAPPTEMSELDDRASEIPSTLRAEGIKINEQSDEDAGVETSGSEMVNFELKGGGRIRFQRNDNLFEQVYKYDQKKGTHLLRTAWKYVLDIPEDEHLEAGISDEFFRRATKDAERSLMKRDRKDDVLVINTGAHIPKEQIEPALRSLMRRTAQILKDIWPGQVVFRGTSLGHDECAKNTEPLSFEGLAQGTEAIQMKYNWAYFGEMNQVAIDELAAAQLRSFQYVNVTMFDLRPDGHHLHADYLPGGVYDCLHWCLPGPMDLWNQLLFHTITVRTSVT